MIIPKWNFKTRACLWIPDLNFHLGVSVLGNILDYHIRLTYWITKYKIFFWSGMLRIHCVQPIWWYAEKVIQSNPVSYVDIWFIYMWCNPLGGGVTCKYILYTGIRNLSGVEFRISFLSIPRSVGHARCFIPSIYYFFTYFHILPYLFIHLFFWWPTRSMQLENILPFWFLINT